MQLPVSGLDVTFRFPDGHDDLAILEAGGNTTTGEAAAATLERALEALSRLAKLTCHPTAPSTSAAPESVSWLNLTVTDFEVALLGLRRFLFGDTVRCIVRCTCSERLEIDFSISHLLHEARPCTPARVQASATCPGWFDLQAKNSLHDPIPRQTTFRLPTVTDQLLALQAPEPYGLLTKRCIHDSHAPGRATMAIERAMQAMSPNLSRSIETVCVACSAPLSAHLYVPFLVLSDLRSSAAHVHREIHIIAATYHWQESAILALPQLRRQAYADAIQQTGAQ